MATLQHKVILKSPGTDNWQREDFTDVESAQAEVHNTRQELLFAPGSTGGGLWGGGKYDSPKNDCMGGYCKGGTLNKP